MVGSYPVPDWLAARPSEQALVDATRVVLHTQERAGIDLSATASSTASTGRNFYELDGWPMTPAVVAFVRAGRPLTNRSAGGRRTRAQHDLRELYRAAGGELSTEHRYGVVYYLVRGTMLPETLMPTM